MKIVIQYIHIPYDIIKEWIMDKKYIGKYWFDVKHRAWSEAKEKWGGKIFLRGSLILLFVVVLTIIGFFAGRFKYPFVIDNITSAIITSLAEIIFGILIAGSFIIYTIYQIPPKMYKELGGFIGNPFELSSRPPLAKQPTAQRYASIIVANTTRTKIEDCFITLDSVINENQKVNILSRQMRLCWNQSVGNENIKKELDIVINVPRIINVAIAPSSSSNEQLEFTTWMGQKMLPIGKYNAKITAHGQWEGKSIDKIGDFIIEFKGMNLITIFDRDKSEWENPNPIGEDEEDQSWNFAGRLG
jgi:uncharacterized integral membrane protein